MSIFFNEKKKVTHAMSINLTEYQAQRIEQLADKHKLKKSKIVRQMIDYCLQKEKTDENEKDS